MSRPSRKLCACQAELPASQRNGVRGCGNYSPVGQTVGQGSLEELPESLKEYSLDYTHIATLETSLANRSFSTLSPYNP